MHACSLSLFVGLLSVNYQLVTQVTTYTTQQTNDMNTRALIVIQIRNCNNEAAADLRLRLQGHWDRPDFIYLHLFP